MYHPFNEGRTGKPEPIDVPTDVVFRLANEFPESGSSIIQVSLSPDVVEVIQNQAGWAIGVKRTSYDLGVEMGDSAELSGHGRVFS